MRVLQVIARMNVGGTATYLGELVSGLSDRGVDVLLMTGHVQEGEQESGILSHLPMVRNSKLGRSVSPARDLQATRQLSSLVQTYSPDIIHSHTFKAGALSRLLYPNIPHAHTFHGTSFHDPEFNAGQRQLMRVVERGLIARTDAPIAVSEHVASDLAQAGLGPKSRFSVIRPGVRPVSLHDRGSARDLLKVPSHAVVVAWLSRFAPVKGPERVLGLAHHFPDVIFVMAGGGPLQASIEARAPDNVLTLGWADPGLVLAASDIAVSTSYSEGLGIALVEAQLAGIPVVATRVGGTREAVKHGETGFIVDMAEFSDALRSLVDDPELRRRLGSSAVVHAAKRFSPEKMVERHLDLYLNLVG